MEYNIRCPVQENSYSKVFKNGIRLVGISKINQCDRWYGEYHSKEIIQFKEVVVFLVV